MSWSDNFAAFLYLDRERKPILQWEGGKVIQLLYQLSTQLSSGTTEGSNRGVDTKD